MKRTVLALVLAAGCMGVVASASAQLGGLIPLKRPNIANIFRPEVGGGAAYEETDSQGQKSRLELSVVGKEMVGTQEAYWMEMGHASADSAALMYGKALVTPGDFVFHKMVFAMPGSTQAMEMDLDEQKTRNRDAMSKDISKWHSVGTESITVPAGTFSCEHWTKDEGKGDAWVSSKVTPMGLVKMVDERQTMVLVKVISDAKTHISGTPVKFDPQMMMKQRMGQQPQP